MSIHEHDGLMLDVADHVKTKAAFKTCRLTPTAFVINEHSDVYDEKPLIYAKIVPSANTILILDTGCGGATKDTKIEIKSLREYIETVPLRANGDKPLNQGGTMRYIVVLSHCHYDHILGVEQFAKDSPILASGHSPSFLSEENLPFNSLCKSLGIDVPHYKPVLVQHLHTLQSSYLEGSQTADAKSTSLGIIVLHTPGHTPDELALWDETEEVLYVGDTLYEYAHIIFPTEGSITEWLRTVDDLIQLVTPFPNARISCGHVTAGRPALDVLTGARRFMADVLARREPVRNRFEKRGEMCVEYVQEGMRFSLVCPERLVEEARERTTSA
ncbi:hypothetical protein NM688_g4344 [Phlebia brevispora]|uniref:Uncharacterized protein n=1 Tax=Phlebia brevispora TaxID=194682 RepID=A0ACC1T3T4_9APHY|nr:hypothetical protein NM688_g4344 [Phlebia brevispora]